MAMVKETTVTEEVNSLRQSFESTVSVEDNKRDQNLNVSSKRQSSTVTATSSAPGALATANQPPKADSKRKSRESSSHTDISGQNPESKISRLILPACIAQSVEMVENNQDATPIDEAQMTNQHQNQAVTDRPTTDLEDTETDDFERYLTVNQLPFYRAARRKMLAHARLARRLVFYDLGQSELLSPYKLMYRPTPPQGIELKPFEIAEWKDSIIQYEQSMLLITSRSCRRDLLIRENKMVIAHEALRVCLQNSTDTWEKAEASLGKKLNSTHIRIGKTYDDLYTAEKNRKSVFDTITNLGKLRQTIAPSNARHIVNSNRQTSRSRSRSRPCNRRQTRSPS